MAKLVIIGGGPSGMMAALTASNYLYKNHQILLIERNERLGRKILATGNGRCNFTNLNNNESFYNEPSFAKIVLDQFNYLNTCSFFEQLGVLQVSDEEGRCYPFTHTSSTILDALRFALDSKSNIKTLTGFKIEKVIYDNGYILVSSSGEKIKADSLIIACGGTSSKNLGSDGSGFTLAKNLNHTITNLYPAITSIKVLDKEFASLNGIRAKATVSLYNLNNNELIVKRSGEVLFKDDSLSGIVSFIISSFIARNLNKDPSLRFYIKLDLVSNLNQEELINFLHLKRQNNQLVNVEFFLNGVVVRMLGIAILKRSKIEYKERLVKDLNDEELERIAQMLKNFEVQVSDLSPFNNAQTTCGGISLDEINPQTLESKLHQNLFFAGEIMDIDGECGGHNLQWAFSSGYVSGKSASLKINERS